MKVILVSLIVLLAGGGGYEWYVQQQHADDFRKQRADDIAQIEKLTQEGRQLQSANDQASQEVANLQAQANTLRAQIAALPTNAPAATAPSAPASAAPPAPVTVH